MNELLTSIISELFKTPSGQIRSIGGVMCIGPGYYLLASGRDAGMFDYALLGTGGLFILISAYMSWQKAKFDAAAKARDVSKPAFEPTKGDMEFLKFISDKLPITVAQIPGLEFPYDANRTKKLLLIASLYKRIEGWVTEGSITKYGDEYSLRDQTEKTIMVQR